jgi:hypothetical protein
LSSCAKVIKMFGPGEVVVVALGFLLGEGLRAAKLKWQLPYFTEGYNYVVIWLQCQPILTSPRPGCGIHPRLLRGWNCRSKT